jgi:hypothetical protein
MTKRLPIPTRDMGELVHLAQLAFEWPIRQAPRLTLPLCILAAAVIQTAMMVLFSISYRSPSDKKPDAPQFYFLPPESTAARQLAPWLEANDPAVFSPLHAARAASPVLPPLKYRPSYEEPPPALLPLRSDPVIPMEPAPLPAGSFLQNYDATRISGTSLARMADKSSSGNQGALHGSTIIQWEDGLSSRLPKTSGEIGSPPAAVSVNAQPALYEVCIGPEGIPMHCVLIESSGDPSSDEAAKIWIMARRFEALDTMSWGRVRVLWGAPASFGTSASPQRPPSSP